MQGFTRIKLPIAVTFPTFSKNEHLRKKLQEYFSDIQFNEQDIQLKGTALIDFLQGRIGAIIARDLITDEVLAALPELKFISKYGVGLDNLDLNALKSRDVQVGWTPGVNARSVSELTLAFILSLLHNVFYTSRLLAQGEWIKDGGTQLSGKTVGIIGCGFIGKDVVRLLEPFGCQILMHDILEMPDFCHQMKIQQVDKKFLLQEADVVSLHVPYDASTHHLIGKSELAFLKPSAILINTSRGNIVDESALHEALQNNRLFSAAMDVFAEERGLEAPLLRHPRFFGTPHIGGNSTEAVLAMGEAAIQNLLALMHGTH